jgi:molecular chaperone DnaK
MANAAGIIYTAEKSVEEYGHVLSQRDIDEIQVAVETLKLLVNGGNIDAIDIGIRQLETLAHRMAVAMSRGGDEGGGEHS